MNLSSIAVTTITYYPNWYRGKLRSIRHTDKIRGDLALEFVRKAKEKGYQVVVSDGQGSKSFRRELSQIPNIHIIKRTSPKRSIGRIMTIKKAARLPDVGVIATSEPEKISFVDKCIPQVVLPILEEKADIVIPKRNDALFKKTYSDYQYESEIEGNELYNEELRSHGFISRGHEDFDVFFGPRVFVNKPSVVSLFTRRYTLQAGYLRLHEYFDLDQYSNSLFFPVELALKKKLRVQSVEVPFQYPHLQKLNEEKGPKELFIEKRKSQRMGILIDLMHFVSYLEGNRKSRIRKIP